MNSLSRNGAAEQRRGGAAAGNPYIYYRSSNMEVHSHTHTSRKKWTHYFWEFLMLFLAVFCGFLAENQREHYIEHKRAKVLANNLYKELLMDSINMSERIQNRLTKEKESEYFLNYISDSSLTELNNHFFPSFYWSFIQTSQVYFEPNDGVLSQLRNSGELRYFRNTTLQTAIGKLNVSINNIRSRNDREYSFLESFLRAFSLKHYDYDWHNKVTDKGTIPAVVAMNDTGRLKEMGKIPQIEQFNREEAKGLISYHLLMLRATRAMYYSQYITVNYELLAILREEYGIE